MMPNNALQRFVTASSERAAGALAARRAASSTRTLGIK